MQTAQDAQDAQTFAAIVAQVIPVFLLAIVADPVHRHLGDDTAAHKRRIFTRGYFTFAILTGLVGEGVALHAVLDGVGPNDVFSMSYQLCVLCGFFALPHLVATFVSREDDFDAVWLLVLQLILPLVAILGFAASVPATDSPTWFKVLLFVLAGATYISAAGGAIRGYLSKQD